MSEPVTIGINNFILDKPHYLFLKDIENINDFYIKRKSWSYLFCDVLYLSYNNKDNIYHISFPKLSPNIYIFNIYCVKTNISFMFFDDYTNEINKIKNIFSVF